MYYKRCGACEYPRILVSLCGLADDANVVAEAQMRTSLLDICKSEYRRLLGLPTCREIALGFVRAMRAARPDSLCPLVRATDPVLRAMGDMEIQTLVLE